MTAQFRRSREGVINADDATTTAMTAQFRRPREEVAAADAGLEDGNYKEVLAESPHGFE